MNDRTRPASTPQIRLGFEERRPTGSSDAAPPPTSALYSDSDVWTRELTRRLRVLLHTVPLDGIRRSDTIRDADLRHYDGLALALRILDVVIDRIGLESEADREVVSRVLGPALSAMDAAAGV